MFDHPNHPILATILGFFFSVSACLFSFFSHTILIVQWFAALAAFIAGTLSVISTVRHWRKKP